MKTGRSPCKYLQMTCIALCLGATHVSVRAQDAPQNELLTPQDFAFPEAPTSSDGYDLLIAAGKNIIPSGEGTPGTLDKLTPEEDLQRQRAFVAKNARSLQMMDEALREPIVPPVGRVMDFVDSSYINNNALRNLARLAIQRNRVYAADKQPKQAVDGSLDVIFMGGEVQKGVTLIGMSSSNTIQAMARGDIWRWHQQLSATEAINAAQRLVTITANMSGFDAIQSEDRRLFLRYLQSNFSDGGVTWMKVMQDEKQVAQMFKPHEVEQMRRLSPRDILNNFHKTTDALVTLAKAPYHRAAPPIVPLDPMSAAPSVFGTSQHYHYLHARNQTANRLLVTALALQAFVKDNKQYPQTLDELAPKYLQTVPRDPFAPESALKYKRDGDKYLLYSVGPDATDNGGAPIPEPTEADRKDEKKWAEMRDPTKMQGDLVVGKSTL